MIRTIKEFIAYIFVAIPILTIVILLYRNNEKIAYLYGFTLTYIISSKISKWLVGEKENE